MSQTKRQAAQSRNLELLLAMRSLATNIRFAAALTRAYRISYVHRISYVPLCEPNETQPWTAVITAIGRPWVPGCGWSAP